MSEAHPTIEAVLSAHGVGDEQTELRRGPRAPAAIAAIIEDILLIQPDQDWRVLAHQETSRAPYHKCTRQEART